MISYVHVANHERNPLVKTSTSLKQALSLFTDYKIAEGTRPSTISGYNQNINLFIQFMPSERSTLADVRPADVIAFLAHERKRGMSGNTIKARDRSLDIFFTWCEIVLEPNTFRSPIRNDRGKRLFKPPKTPQKEPRRATDAQIDGLILSIPKGTWMDLRDRAILSLLRDTGMRVSEAVALRVVDVDCAKLLTTIQYSKNGKYRTIPFSQATVHATQAYLMMRPWCPPDVSPFLLVGATNEHGAVESHFTDSGVRQMLHRRCEQARIDYINPHSIRHLFGIRALNSGIRAEVVSKMMGHHSVDFTIKFYAPLLTETMQREYNERW